MIVVQIIGGLGSQMSQYAFASALRKAGYFVKLDISLFSAYKLHDFELEYFDIDTEIASMSELKPFLNKNVFVRILIFLFPLSTALKIINKLGMELFNCNVLAEDNHDFDGKYLRPPENCYIKGDFKSEKYFENSRAELTRSFKVSDSRSPYVLELKRAIEMSFESCFVHVRRGDFATDGKTRAVHGVCQPTYYKAATDFIRERFPKVKFFIFSNDIEWCRENLTINDAYFVDSAYRGHPFEDIYLMSSCTHGIIDHSAFCWWGAWLNESPRKIVVAPQNWFADPNLNKHIDDIYCDGWVRM